MESARLLAPAGTPYTPQQQQQQQQPPQQQQQLAPAPPANAAPGAMLAPAPGGGGGGLEGYDMSSLDQLQAQLSASAGLTNLLMPNGQPMQEQLQQQQHQHQLPGQPPQPPQQPQQQQQPFIFLQPAANGGQGLQQMANYGAPGQHQQPQQQQPQQGDGQQQQQQQPVPPPGQFVFAGGQPGSIPGMPPGFSQQLFAAASQGGAALTLGPNGTYQPTQQSYSSAGVPIPMPMLAPQQQQQQVAQQQQLQPGQLQPLQPAPPALAASLAVDPSKNGGAAGGNLSGNKRPHDSSVISAASTTMSLGSFGMVNPAAAIAANGAAAAVAGIAPPPASTTNMSMDMNDYPEFQLRNKDGSVITEADLEKMSPAERRRYERNLREQQRSFRISQQIQQLKDVLSESKVPFKPNKYSILVSVADYIKQLQTRAIMLDSEHKKLFKTIQETNEMVASGQIPDPNTAGGGGEPPQSGDQNAANNAQQGEQTFVQGLDYQAVFDQTPTANGVASIDGRILACNKELESILDCSRDQIERQSLFTLVQNHQEIFEAMAELLKRADALSNGSLTADPVQLLYWSGGVMTPGEKKLGMNITLACTKEGSPKFFSFCMAPAPPSP